MRFEITENKPLTPQVRSMRLAGDAAAFTRPGQFVQAALPGFYLRRPISVCQWTPESLRLVYKIVGPGTEAMAGLQPGAELDLLTGLGNGFDPDACGERPLLVGGGVGLPPLLGLCEALLRQGKRPRVAAGFGSAGEVFLAEDFEALGVPVDIATLDGSRGRKGLVTEGLPEAPDGLCACGPLPMLKALWRRFGGRGQYSLEERMGCGFGACMGCSIQTAGGPRRVCKEGPVFRGEELLWA